MIERIEETIEIQNGGMLDLISENTNILDKMMFYKINEIIDILNDKKDVDTQKSICNDYIKKSDLRNFIESEYNRDYDPSGFMRAKLERIKSHFKL